MKRTMPILILALAAVLAGGEGQVAAEEADLAVSPPRARLVEVFLRVRQALLFDKNRDEYVVVKRGDRFQGFLVSAIDSDQIVLTGAGRPRAHYVLPLAPERRPATRSSQPGSPGQLRILDPYLETRGDDLRVVDPYGEGRQIPSVTAPPSSRAGQGEKGEERAEPAEPAKEAPEAKAGAGAEKSGAGAKEAGETKKAGAKPREERRTVPRAELDEVLADFHALGKEVEIERTESGTIRITGLARGSFLHRLGLREGDVVLSVAGRQIDNADRAAAVYVELTVADRFDVELNRGGSPLTIRYQVK